MKIQYEQTAARFCLSVKEGITCRFFADAELDGERIGRLKWRVANQSEFETLYKASNRHGVWQLRIRHSDGKVQVGFGATLSRKVSKAILKPVCFEAFSADHLLVHGRKMGGCSSHLLKEKEALSLTSVFLFCITQNGQTLQLGHPLKQDHLSSFACQTKGKRVEVLEAQTVVLPCDRKRVKAAPVTIAFAADPHRQMVEWVEEQIDGRELIQVPQESGWNSWDYYRWTITEDEVLRNAEFIASDPVLSRHIRRIIVDDGWQYCYGEWEANSLFPSGMKKLAQRLKRMGFTPGLWFAPTIAEPHSRVAQLEPEMLMSGEAGVPCLAFSCMERNGFVLDPTHPKVIEWWKTIFSRYAADGYRYFKLDFLSWSVEPYRFHRKDARPGELMRYIVEPIREAVGPKARILGCNFCFGVDQGLVDDVRVVSDIHASWAFVKHTAVAVGARFWAHRRLWINDPDFAVCRGDETTNDPDLHRLKMLLPYVKPSVKNRELAPGLDAMDSLADLTAREAQTWLSMVVISGGAVNLSDNLPRLNEIGLDLVRKTVMAERGDAGIALDLFRSELPSYWVQKVRPGLSRILLVNWGDRRKAFKLDLRPLNLSSLGLANFWTGEPVPVTGCRLEADLPPHGCLLLESRS